MHSKDKFMNVFLRNVITPFGFLRCRNVQQIVKYSAHFHTAAIRFSLKIPDTSSFHPATASFERVEPSEEKEPLQT